MPSSPRPPSSVLVPLFLFFAFVVVAVFSVAVPRYPVLGSEFAHGDADQEAAVADEGDPGRSAPHLETAAGQDAEELLLFLLVIRFLTSLVFLFFLFPREFPRGCREARNLVVARLAVETVQMPAKHPDSPGRRGTSHSLRRRCPPT